MKKDIPMQRAIAHVVRECEKERILTIYYCITIKERIAFFFRFRQAIRYDDSRAL